MDAVGSGGGLAGGLNGGQGELSRNTQAELGTWDPKQLRPQGAECV